MTMADGVAVMNKGRIEQMGAPEQLYELPTTAFVANFLGQSNLVRGTVAEVRSDGAVGVDVGGERVLVRADRAAATSGQVLVGVRPEKISMLVDAQEPVAGQNVIGPGVVTDVSFTGVSTQYQVDVPGVGVFGVFAQNLVGAATVSLGSKVRLAWAARFTFSLDGREDASEGTYDVDDEP